MGCTHATYQQVFAGVPVFSGVVKVHRNGAGQFIAANGDFFRIAPKLDTNPALAETTAHSLAAAAVEGGWPTVEHSELVIVDPGWYGDPPIGAHLAYHVILADRTDAIHEALFIDAHSGNVLDRWRLVCDARVRSVHDAGGTDELPGPLARDENIGTTGIADVDSAFDYLGDTYDYYFRAFGRDGYDDQGSPYVTTVNSTAPACPNAFWHPGLLQSAFCTGTVTDDLVAHEMTHGLTQHTANLIYQNQSGQLNESFSDVFGELVDLFNGDAAFADTTGVPPLWPDHPTGPGSDTPNNRRSFCSLKPSYNDGFRWLMAEDGSASYPFDGVLRDMWEPTCQGDPDRANSPYQTCNLLDNGGVHSGSGIPNHAFAMLTDGKSFNGYTVSGIGPIKAGAVWYRALTVYLTIASDFRDAYAALNQAAADLVGTVPNDPRTGAPSGSTFTADDAAQVDLALRAAEMDTPGACGATIPVLDPTPPEVCAAPQIIFEDDFEAGTNGWTVSNTAPPTPYDWVQSNGLPFDRAGTAWFCADPVLGDCGEGGVSEAAIHSLISPVIPLPGNLSLPVARFDHFVETEPRYDGGVVQIRVDGGAWQPIPPIAFTHNPYNTILFFESQGSDSPLAGQRTFSGVGGAWGTSTIDLGTFVEAGDSVQLRFDFSKDACFGYTGWYLDDFELYHCPASTDCNQNGTPDELDVEPGIHTELILEQPSNHSSGNPSDLDDGGYGVTALAADFMLLRSQEIGSLRLWGGYYPTSTAPQDDHFTVRFHQEAGGLPGVVVAAQTDVPSVRTLTGRTFLAAEIDEWVYTLSLDEPVTLQPGTYFAEILNDTTASTETFIWGRAIVGDIPGAAYAYEPPGVTWYYDPLINLSLELYSPELGIDCNSNSVLDDCECGDHDGDADVDLDDLATLVNCISGPQSSAAGDCGCILDADDDGDVDLADFAAFQVCISP
ncbi:MAG: M4 family metallopeptidase [bacterium]|nr:M4 family metallopeptidase [bacterium]